ncbi:MAG: AI-2E family transporter, partial [Planctomycetes bacterium]|nr:AI-2E family transporter [Planctomycetota bacterium]
VLYLARSVVLPLVLAMFLTAIIGPLLRFLHRRLPLGVSIVIVLLILALVVVGGTALFAYTSFRVAERAPKYVDRFQARFEFLVTAAQKQGLPLNWDQIGVKKVTDYALQFVGAGLESVLSMVGQAVLVLFLTIFLALEAAQFRKKIDAGFHTIVRSKIQSTIADISKQIQRYAATKTLLSLLIGACNFVVCSALGIDFPFFWAALAFLLNFIPNVGSLIAIAPPVFLAFVQFDGLGRPVATLAILVVLQNLIGNLIEPKLLGRSMNVSALVVFLSMIFWGWLWGIIGVVLAVPLTVGVKIACGHVEALRPISVILGGDPIEPKPASPY